jgi:hypothetical protein
MSDESEGGRVLRIRAGRVNLACDSARTFHEVESHIAFDNDEVVSQRVLWNGKVEGRTYAFGSSRAGQAEIELAARAGQLGFGLSLARPSSQTPTPTPSSDSATEIS